MILVVKGEDYKNINLVINNARRFIKPDIIYIITPYEDMIKYNDIIDNKNFFFINEKLILDINSIDFSNGTIPGMPERRFWYYQQFLKMAFAYSDYCKKNYYLIWDADTVPLKPIDFFKNDKVYLTISQDEYNNTYFDNIRILLNNINIYKHSFISQHLMVNKNIMCNLISELGNKDNWCTNVMNKVKGNRKSVFSEYETYANYVLSRYPEYYEVRSLKWFRHCKEIINYYKSIDSLSKYYYFISFEKNKVHFMKKIYYIYKHLKNIWIIEK